jgi:hypothetical protein
MAASNSFLGTGWGFPPTFIATARSVGMTEGQEDIHNSLAILLSTALGERVMLPDYGCNLEELLFEPMDTGLSTLLFDRIRTSILYYEPRIEVEDITVQTDRVTEGLLLIEVLYRVRANNSRFNFVFPFYKNEGTQIGTLP